MRNMNIIVGNAIWSWPL